MPRTSAVDQLGVGDRVMQLAIVEQKSIPTVIETIADETGVVLSDDMVRNWLKVQPAEIIEKAERIGLAKDLKPLLDYANQVKRTMERVETLATKIEQAIEGSSLESDSVFAHILAGEVEVGADVVLRIMARVQKEHMGPKLMSLMVRYLESARKLLETAHKIDPSVRGGAGAGRGLATGRPIHIDKAIITGDDLTSLFQEARMKRAAMDA